MLKPCCTILLFYVATLKHSIKVVTTLTNQVIHKVSHVGQPTATARQSYRLL